MEERTKKKNNRKFFFLIAWSYKFSWSFSHLSNLIAWCSWYNKYTNEMEKKKIKWTAIALSRKKNQQTIQIITFFPLNMGNYSLFFLSLSSSSLCMRPSKTGRELDQTHKNDSRLISIFKSKRIRSKNVISCVTIVYVNPAHHHQCTTRHWTRWGSFLFMQRTTETK